MYINHLYTLESGDIVEYRDNFNKERQIIFVKDTGLVRAIKNQDYCLQQQFLDENGAIVHVPINAWKFLKTSALIRRRKP